MLDLLSNTSRVETPFISVTIGDYAFGIYNQTREKIIDNNKIYSNISKIFPNYMKSLNVTKINGAVNTYVLVMTYTIRPGDDPNLLERVFGSVSKNKLWRSISAYLLFQRRRSYYNKCHQFY